MIEINAPDFSDYAEAGTIIKWFKDEGDIVGKGDELVEIEAGEQSIIVESRKSGRLCSVFAEEGDIIEPEELLAEIDDEDTIDDIEKEYEE